MVRHGVLKGLYDVEKTVGCGGFAKVKLATHLATGEKVAIKVMDKVALGDDLSRVTLELKALKTLSHQHICKLYEVIETETHFFIVIEYCSGGELFDHIVEKNRLTEQESRMFFRQIVSAVAYLHSLGYAHRDLKPENVLLDKDQNLKLIDFGLCARPDGGMTSPLYTSCGSPTYAAPELVLGRQYLGPEVDVWAMGVLLYALLVGSLPFDDLNIDSLYKKILNGKYDEPRFLSPESKRLIKSMLQTDPKKRITVNELLSHPWLTLGVLDPVEFRSEDSRKFDMACVLALAEHYDLDRDRVLRQLKRWKYDYHTATYLLLQAKKKRGSALKLNTVPAHTQLRLRLALTANTPLNTRRPPQIHLPVAQSSPATPSLTRTTAKQQTETPPSVLTTRKFATVARRSQHRDVSTIMTPKNSQRVCKHSENTNVLDRAKENETVATGGKSDSPNGGFLEPQRPANGIRKPLKRLRSPTLDSECSPVPSKKLTTGNEKSTPVTPDRKKPPLSSETPGTARRVLGTIERSLNKVKSALTPRRQAAVESARQPVLLSSKDLCNVSTTQSSDPEYVITELMMAFQKKGFHCDRKGFTLRGKVDANVLHPCSGCSFELEICYLPLLGPSSIANFGTPTKSILKNGLSLGTPTSTPTSSKHKEIDIAASDNKGYSFIGIRRKRLKGDSWCYKRVCEEILAVTVKDFKVTESSV